MSHYSKYNIVYRLQKWMDSVPGQTFLNYAYSWGASIVILGTLFKLTHLKGANFMLFLGMGTEVFVFFLSAFDRPFDKTAEGRDLPIHFDEEGEGIENSDESAPEGVEATQAGSTQPQPTIVVTGGQPFAGGSAVAATGQTIITGSQSLDGGNAQTAAESETSTSEESVDSQTNASNTGAAAAGQPVAGGGTVFAGSVPQTPAWVSQQTEMSPEMAEAQNSYVEELNKLVETLGKVNEQSERLTRDSEEMENLNRTLTGITKIYEMQLKGASQQVGTIDQINEQTKKMAEQIDQLNKIYARMIEAMTVNMRAAAPNTEVGK